MTAHDARTRARHRLSGVFGIALIAKTCPHVPDAVGQRITGTTGATHQRFTTARNAKEPTMAKGEKAVEDQLCQDCLEDLICCGKDEDE
jgi:hypothetical protein